MTLTAQEIDTYISERQSYVNFDPTGQANGIHFLTVEDVRALLALVLPATPAPKCKNPAMWCFCEKESPGPDKLCTVCGQQCSAPATQAAMTALTAEQANALLEAGLRSRVFVEDGATQAAQGERKCVCDIKNNSTVCGAYILMSGFASCYRAGCNHLPDCHNKEP